MFVFLQGWGLGSGVEVTLACRGFCKNISGTRRLVCGGSYMCSGDGRKGLG